MSTLADLRTDLGRWLMDTVGEQWSPTVLNRYVNLGLREVEKHILAVDPEAFKCIYTAATTVPADGKDSIYTYPAGLFAVHEIAISSDGVNYVPIQRLPLKTIREDRAGSSSLIGFVPFDAKHFILWPGAATAVASALRCIVAPTLVMTDDTDEQPLPLAFENLHMLETQLICLRDTGEETDKVEKQINQIRQETPRFFLTVTEPSFIVPIMPGGRYPGE